jgi:hypothetical protein
MLQFWFFPVALLGALCAAALIAAWPAWRRRRHRAFFAQARQRFVKRREWLEARFMTLATKSGKPRGLEWVNCEFDNAVRFARDRDTGNFRALVAVTISFRAIEGGGMEDVEAVGNLRAATAVFLFEGNEWTTLGQVLFNLSPDQAIERFQHELETVD